MRRVSGYVGFGLVLASTWAACSSEQSAGERASLSAADRPVVAEAQSPAEVILAVRTQLTRAFGQTTILPGVRPPRAALATFLEVGNRAPSAIEFLGTSGDAQDVVAHVALPERADGAFHLQDVSNGVAIEVGLEGATGAVREEADGYAIYRGGYLQGAHIVYRTTSAGTEDYVFFPEKAPEKSELRYRVKLGDAVAGLRLIHQSIEMVDMGGAPRLRMNTPYAIDGDGRRLTMNVAIDDCAYDSSIQLPWGRPPVNPGARECTIRLSWPSEAKAPLVVDPQWALTKDMQEVRMNATASIVMVANKYRVLVIGGDSGTGAAAASQTTEIFDEASNSWTSGPMLKVPRTDHSSLMLGQTVHVIGGRNGSGTLNNSEKIVFDNQGTASVQFASGNMTVARARPGVLAFDNNSGVPKIFVAGGLGSDGKSLKSIEVYDSGIGWVQSSAFMTTARSGHTVTFATPPPVPAGAPPGTTFALSAFITGGKNDVGDILGSAERCMLLSGQFNIECKTQLEGVSIPAMKKARVNHTAVYDEGTKRVLVFGGDGQNSVECYNPPANAWGLINGSAMQSARSFFTVTALPPGNGKYLIVGGVDTAQNSVLDTVDQFDAKIDTVTQFPHNLKKPRSRHSTVIVPYLPDPRPLVIGGAMDNIGTAELLQCSNDSECESVNGGNSYCAANGFCLPQKMQGTACNVDTDCLDGKPCNMCAPVEGADTGFCADGYCCDVACKDVCASCGLAGSLGTCSVAPKGKPPIGHGPCLPDGYEEKDVPCTGKCDGITPDSCEYQDGKSCGVTCIDDSDPLVPSKTTELVCNADGFCIEGTVTTPCGAYTCADELSCRINCTETIQCIGGHVCSNGQCIPGQTYCAKSGDNVSAEDTVQSTLDPKANVPCWPYRCDDGACLTKCTSVYDCVANPNEVPVKTYVCDDNNTCVPVTPDILPGGQDVSCALSPDQQSSRFGWLAAIALAGAIAARRNRPRA